MLLAGEFVRIEQGVVEDVAEDIDGERHVFLEDARIVGRRLDTGRGVDFAAYRLDFLGDLRRRALRRALERHVLEKVRQAVLVVPFRARSGADPDAEGGAFQVLHVMGDDGQAGRETRYANGHALTPFPVTCRHARR